MAKVFTFESHSDWEKTLDNLGNVGCGANENNLTITAQNNKIADDIEYAAVGDYTVKKG